MIVLSHVMWQLWNNHCIKRRHSISPSACHCAPKINNSCSDPLYLRWQLCILSWALSDWSGIIGDFSIFLSHLFISVMMYLQTSWKHSTDCILSSRLPCIIKLEDGIALQSYKICIINNWILVISTMSISVTDSVETTFTGGQFLLFYK